MRIDEVVQTSHARGVDTRRLYSFEARYFRGTSASKVLPMSTLQALAVKIWKKYGAGKEMPKVVAGRGTKHGNAWFSYSQGGEYIQLSRNQRNFLVLIHELIHAMGYDDHDTRFIEIYLKLLIEYLKLDPQQLMDAAREYRLIK